MRILVVSTLLLSLASCTLPGMDTPITSPTNSGTTTPITDKVSTYVASTDTHVPLPCELPVVSQTGTTRTGAKEGSVLTLNYTLRTGSPTGTIVETTIESVARANGLYQTGATYQPFSVVLGQQQVIRGFEAGLLGTSKGEKKSIKVSPLDGYGCPKTIPKEQVTADVELTRDAGVFEDVFVQVVEKDKFPSEMQEQIKNAKIGATLTGANNAVATITAISTGSITLAIDNKNNPFHGKTISVGATATIPATTDSKGADIRITAIDAATKKVTFIVSNKGSPFYGIALEKGAVVQMPDGSGTITVLEVAKNTVTLSSNHKFANVDLYFDIEVVSVK